MRLCMVVGCQDTVCGGGIRSDQVSARHPYLPSTYLTLYLTYLSLFSIHARRWYEAASRGASALRLRMRVMSVV